METRKFRPEDAESASEILLNAFSGFLGNKIRECGSFAPENLVKEANCQDHFKEPALFVAEEKDRIVGVIKVTSGTNGLGSLDYVGVDPGYHGHGVGTILMKRAEEFWIEHKQRKIATCVAVHNRKAIMYYLKNNFIPEGCCRDHFFEGVDEIILGRFLKKTSP